MVFDVPYQMYPSVEALALTYLTSDVTIPPPMQNNRAQLVHIEVDRRLGHEWDEWDGKPLPNNGDFTSSPWLFFRFAMLTLLIMGGAIVVFVFLVAPRLAVIWSSLPVVLLAAVAVAGAGAVLWLGVMALSFRLGTPLLPERLAERGPYLKLMSLAGRVAGWFGRRDWVENAAIAVYNRLAEQRARKIQSDELLVLIPRCLSKQALDGVLGIAARHQVPVFVATRGQLARRAIRERRPRAVVAVACERDMLTGLKDVAGSIPVLALTMQLPAGPCKDAVIDLRQMEEWVRHYVS